MIEQLSNHTNVLAFWALVIVRAFGKATKESRDRKIPVRTL